ncbi:UNVERIFIED_CONTAM: hypothetical protein GTU68_021992 [Idotea baltica]|nr:hypothetical protein [Idotea baltica]
MSKIYSVKEIYYTLQGEGFHSGRPAVFCRFSGCNLWTGREEDRHKAICQFCDTDFVGTDGENGDCFVVCTGGEPALQMDDALIAEMHDSGIEVAIETNGTIELPKGIDWITMSPKANSEIVVKQGHELKIVYPQVEIKPEDFADFDFQHFYVQPMDSPTKEENLKQSIEFVKQNPQWKLSVQTHKQIGIL